jgi:carbon-monoxide dehydrogenase medium subunit
VTGAYQTALAADEVLEAVTIPRLSATARFGYFKLCRKAGEFALAMSAVLNDPDQHVCRIVIGATKGRPIILRDGRELMRGGDPSALLSLLEQHGIADRNAQRQQMAAVARAFEQTVA